MPYITEVAPADHQGYSFDFILRYQDEHTLPQDVGRCRIRVLRDRTYMARMYNLYIEPMYRGRGLARTFTALVMDYARRMWGVSVLRMKVRKDNDASVAVYRRLQARFIDYSPEKWKVSMVLVQNNGRMHKEPSDVLFQAMYNAVRWNYDYQQRYQQTGFSELYFRQFAQYDQWAFEPPARRREVRLNDVGNVWQIPMPAQFIEHNNEIFNVLPERDRIIGRHQGRIFGKKAGESPPPPKPRTPDMFDALPTYERFRLPGVGHPMLSPKGVNEMMIYLHNHGLCAWNYTTFSDLVGLEVTIAKHTFEYHGDDVNAGGKLVARIDKILQTMHRRKLDESQKNDLNQILDMHTLGGEGDFFFDIATKVDWESGAFGEKDAANGASCWWNDGGLRSKNSQVSRFSAAMPDKALALRLWSQTANGDWQGVGRVWVWRTQEGYPILFNAYGMQLMKWAAKLAKYLNFDNYEKVNLAISDLFINNKVGIMIGQPEDYVGPGLVHGKL